MYRSETARHALSTEAIVPPVCSVVIVEPHGPTSTLLTEMITLLGCSYLALPMSFDEACQWLQQRQDQQPVIALIDCSFAHPSLARFLALVRAERGRSYPLKVIGMTSHPRPAEGIRKEVDILLLKPILPEDLVRSFSC